MNYKKCVEKGDEGVNMITNWLRRENHVVKTDKGRLAKELQKRYGDLFLENKSGEVLAIEVKTDDTNYKNFFLEEWSNRKWKTKGWMYNLNCDYLIYCFRQQGLLFIIDFQQLKIWFELHKESFPLKAESKSNQKNDTWGRCVPVSRLLECTDVLVNKRKIDFKTIAA